MKLFVDDLRKCPEGWELARTNTEAIRLLATGHVTEISIDHDIAFFAPDIHSKMCLSIGEETFQPVVYYICAMKPEMRPKEITMHTANYSAGLRMYTLLRDHGILSAVNESAQDFEDCADAY